HLPIASFTAGARMPGARGPETAHRVALVTGAGSGLGRAIAIELGVRGWSIALVGRRASLLAETAREIETGSGARASGAPPVARVDAAGPAMVLPADVTDEAGVRAVIGELQGRAGCLDLIVHGAGFGRFESLTETTPDRFKETIAVNLTAVFVVT